MTWQNVHEYDTWSNSGPLASKVINWVNVIAITLLYEADPFVNVCLLPIKNALSDQLVIHYKYIPWTPAELWACQNRYHIIEFDVMVIRFQLYVTCMRIQKVIQHFVITDSLQPAQTEI